MSRLGEENVFLRLAVAPVDHIFEQDQNAGAVIIGVNQTTRAYEHGSPADGGEVGPSPRIQRR